jgi:hypothetical protein
VVASASVLASHPHFFFTVPSNVQNLQVTNDGFAVRLSWSAPAQPNGPITSYEVHRGGALIFSGTATSYLDTGVTPGQSYQYTVFALTRAAASSGVSASATVPEDTPVGQAAPTVVTTLPTSLSLVWQAPSSPNGQLTYSVLVNGSSVLSGLADTSAVVSSLAPFTVYSIMVRACNSAGCVSSAPTSTRTAPTGERNKRERETERERGRERQREREAKGETLIEIQRDRH